MILGTLEQLSQRAVPHAETEIAANLPQFRYAMMTSAWSRTTASGK